MPTINISGREALDIINHSHPVYKTIQNELEDVDDHGDATQVVVFQTVEDKYYVFSYIQQKEWGAMIEDKDILDCDEVKPVTKLITIYERIPTVQKG